MSCWFRYLVQICIRSLDDLNKRGKKQKKEARSWSRCTFFHILDADIKSVQLILCHPSTLIQYVDERFQQQQVPQVKHFATGWCFKSQDVPFRGGFWGHCRRVPQLAGGFTYATCWWGRLALGLGRGSRIHEHAEHAHSTPKFHEIWVPREASWDHVRSLVCWRISTAIARAPCPIYLNKDFIIPPGQHTWATQPLEVIGRPVVWLFVQVMLTSY